MAFFDYDRNGKKDWKDNAREYYLYNKLKEDDASKHSQGKMTEFRKPLPALTEIR